MHSNDWLKPDAYRLMALAIFGTGIGISGIAGGAECAHATLLSDTKSRYGMSWSNAIAAAARVGLSGGVMMAMNFSFDTPCFSLSLCLGDACGDVNPADSRGSLQSRPLSPDSLPRAGVVNIGASQ